MMTSAINDKSEQAEQIKALKMELCEVQRNLKITTVMADSYGAMAIGQDYENYKGYHDAEMWTYAEKRLENLEEIKACEDVMREINPGQATSSVRPVRKKEEKGRSTSRPRRHGYD